MSQSLVFHVLHVKEREGLRWVRSGTEPESYYALWDGLPPIPLNEEVAGLAETVLQGQMNGHRVYGEGLPAGVPLSQVDVPSGLESEITRGALAVVTQLHERGCVHGQVTSEFVFLTIDGEVILVGRNRHGGLKQDDLDGVAQLFEKTAVGPVRTGGESPVDLDPEESTVLGAWVGEHMKTMRILGEVWVEPSDYLEGRVDEIIPDIGPDTGRGLLDPWTSPDSGWEQTVERTDVGIRSDEHALFVELWGRITAGPQSRVPSDRFASIEGHPSPALRSLIRGERPAPLPMFLEGGHSGDDLFFADGRRVERMGFPAILSAIRVKGKVLWILPFGCLLLLFLGVSVGGVLHFLVE